MDKRVSILILLLTQGFLCFSQKIEESIIWNANEKLVWANFKGKIPPSAASAAITASGISYKYSANLLHHEVKLDFEVTAFFYPNESWYKPTLCDDHVLSHEQLHFDIAELFARKMRKRLNETSFSDNVKAEVKDIYKEILKELADFQHLYDWETNFSRNKEKQLLWNKKIAKILSEEN